MHRSMKDVEKRARTLKYRLRRALEKPALHDPVYKACQRVFHKHDDPNLSRDDNADLRFAEKRSRDSYMAAHRARKMILR